MSTQPTPHEGLSPGATTAPVNRLIEATSPYLLQHAHNPVAWYPWGTAAMARAKAENKPIFLSIGYAACHWCHVMAHQVFENPQIAAVMNQHFINIKVDREERPDLDDLYMLATQLTTGSGGWPMSVWLTPELEPFYAGTYFPPEDAYGRPGFPRLCQALAEAWQNRPADLRAQARRVADAVKMYADETAGAAGPHPVDLPAWLTLAVEQQADRFDDEYGGMGQAPKFPPSQALALWLELLKAGSASAASNVMSTPGAPEVSKPMLPESSTTLVRTMLTTTLDHMMRGGIYDQVGGAFARYSTDQYWLVPHFEKMLYDNAQLAAVYAVASVVLNRPDYARVARQTLDFWLREMTSPRGAFYSTLDADSEGVEGRFYVWTIAQIHEVLPNAEDAELIIEHLGVTAEGNWHEGGPGANVLHVAGRVQELAEKRQVPVEALQKRLDTLLKTLREVRSRRVGPGLDDKVLTSWNGLMISALAIAGRLLHEPKYLEAAHRAIGFLLLHHMERGRRLLRTSRAPADAPRDAITAHIDAFLEDHAYLLNGLMDLIDSTMPTSLPGTMARKRALELADAMIHGFADREHGGFFFTSPQHEQLFARLKNATDGATPSANGVAIRALLRLARVSGKVEYRETALKAVEAFTATVAKQPSAFCTILQGLVEDARWNAAHAHLSTPLGKDEEVDLLLKAAGSATAGGTVGGVGEAPRSPMALALEGPGVIHAKAGATVDLVLTLRIGRGYHIPVNHPADREAFSTVARVRAEKVPIASQRWDYPPGQDLPLGPGTTHQGYTGTIAITGHLVLAPHALPGRHTLRATVLAQPCSGTSCLPPEKATVEIPMEVE